VFAHFPNLENEYFDWDEIIDPSSPEPVSHLASLDQRGPSFKELRTLNFVEQIARLLLLLS